MSDTERTDRIRRRAYELWEQDGRPHGQSEVYWQLATELVEAEEADDKPPEPPAPP